MQREISALWSEKKVVLRQTARAVTPWGGLSVFVRLGQVLAARQVGGGKQRRQVTGNGHSDLRCPQRRPWQFKLYNTTIAAAIADRLEENSEIFLLGGVSLCKAQKSPPPPAS